MPGKETWLLLEDDGELEFECRLAKDLGKTLRELRELMDNSEFLIWSRWYARRDAERELAAKTAGG